LIALRCAARNLGVEAFDGAHQRIKPKPKMIAAKERKERIDKKPSLGSLCSFAAKIFPKLSDFELLQCRDILLRQGCGGQEGLNVGLDRLPRFTLRSRRREEALINSGVAFFRMSLVTPAATMARMNRTA
jgi:hypothetical protein